MKRTLGVVLSAVVWNGVFAFCAIDVARGQTPAPAAAPAAAAAPAPLPANIQTATSLTPQQKSQMQSFVTGQVAAMTAGGADPNSASISAAREALISAALVNGRAGATPTFLDEYAAQLNAALVPALAQASLPARLNIGIVVARVAEQAQTSQLREIAAKLVEDKDQPVVLWGIRAARWIIPSIVRNPVLASDVHLRDAVPQAVKNNTTGVLAGDIVREAYDALALDLFDPAKRRSITPQMIKGVLSQLQVLLRLRVEQYRLGIPAMPLADRTGINFLWDRDVWAVQAPQQKLETAQLMADLASLAAQQAAAAQDPADLLTLVVTDVKAISILGEAVQPPAAEVTEAANAVINLPKGTAASQVVQAVQALVSKMQAAPQFKGLKAPPAIEPGRAGVDNAPPASGPSTAPAQGSGTPQIATTGPSAATALPASR